MIFKKLLSLFPPLEVWTLETLKRMVASNTIRMIVAGAIVHFAIKQTWLPDSFFANAVAGVCDLLAIVFRVSAVVDLKTGGGLS